MALGQMAGCPRVNRAKKVYVFASKYRKYRLSLWSTGGLSQGCPDFQKVNVFKVYVPFSCPNMNKHLENHVQNCFRKEKMDPYRPYFLSFLLGGRGNTPTPSQDDGYTTNPLWGGKTGSICHFAEDTQMLGKTARESSVSKC